MLSSLMSNCFKKQKPRHKLGLTASDSIPLTMDGDPKVGSQGFMKESLTQVEP